MCLIIELWNLDKLITVVAKISPDVMEKAQDVYNLVSEEMKGLNKDKAIAWGQVLESLVIKLFGVVGVN
jgi:hypothetical protein